MRRFGTIIPAVFLIVMGLLLLINAMFGLHLPVFRTMMALALLLVGVYLLMRSSHRGQQGEYRAPNQGGNYSTSGSRTHQTLFGTDVVNGSAETTEYNVAFGEATIHLPQELPPVIHVHVVFGSAKVILPADACVRVQLSAAFGAADMPGASVQGFGNRETQYGAGNACLLQGDVAFGEIRVFFASPQQETQA